MLLQRVLTAIVLAPLMLAGIFWLPDLWFRVFIGLILMIGAWEWSQLSGYNKPSSRLFTALSMGALLIGIHLWVPSDSRLWMVMISMSLLWWAFALFSVLRYPNSANWLQSRKLRLLAGVPVLVPLWLGLVMLKGQPLQILGLTWLMLLVWGADIGAYFAGRAFGDRKLAPHVSPGKTWAGVYGGMLTSILISIVIALLGLLNGGLSPMQWFFLLVLSAGVVAISVLGDLMESLLKRNRGIKDSSSLLPGHGGVLDRIDSLCAATPLFVLLWIVMVGV